MKNKQAKIAFNVPFDSYPIIAARVAMAVHSKKKVSKTDKMLSYLIKHNQEGIYHTRNGSRKECLRKLNITVSQYEWALNKLVEMGLILRRKGDWEDRTTRIFYEFNPFLKGICKKYLEDMKKV